jgi:hypothetical protein
VTRDHARKKAVRARMDASSESYSTAARKLGAARATGDPAAAEVIIARVNSTLASPRARIEMRADWVSSRGLGRQERHRPGPVGRLAAFAAKAVVRRISPETDLASVREKLKRGLMHPAGEGFVEPAAERYRIDFGEFAVMEFNGQHYRGVPGTPLQARHRTQEFPGAPLELLRTLRDVTDARPAGHETVHGTPCQIIAVRVGPAEFTVWIDGDHIRRVQTEESGSSERISLSLRKTLELWDFGAEDVSADWTHLPSFQTAEDRTTSDR